MLRELRNRLVIGDKDSWFSPELAHRVW